jgi:hypothetical protein
LTDLDERPESGENVVVAARPAAPDMLAPPVLQETDVVAATH